MVSGIIKSNNRKSIIGLAPNAQLLFGKVVDNNGQCGFNALVAGVLWSVVKEVDIIIIALGSPYDYMVLKDAIKKARSHNICIFTAIGSNIEADYPSYYQETIATGFLTRSKEKNDIIIKKADLYLPNKSLYSTYLDNNYVRASGSSISSAFFAGLAAVLIEQYKKGRKRNIPDLVLTKLKQIFKQGKIYDSKR